MFAISKVMIIFGIILASILFWATSNVCRYNFALEKRTETLNIVTEELDPSLGNAKYYVYDELNCNHVDMSWDLDRVVENFQTLTVLIYQELTTDIKGDPNY
tara:strand:- start:324 stop:629 length:306 start_codon:yes stop_codon:yes gene_type:complete